MRWRGLTLRSKLTLLYLVVFGMILTGLSAVLLTMREWHIRRDFDERLVDRARAMAEAIELADAGDGSRSGQNRSAHLIPFRFPGYYFQLREADGAVLERSENLGEQELPLSLTGRASCKTDEPILETVDDEVAVGLLGKQGRLRVLTWCQSPPGLEPFFLQIGVSLGPLEATVTKLQRLFLVVIPAGLLLAGIASWLIARRALEPIGRIAREARKLTAAHLDRRVAMPVGRDEVAEMVLTLNEMLDRLQAAFIAQERFIANAAHELKTPAAILLGQAQVLAQQRRTVDEYERFLVSVQGETRRIGGMVNSLLTLARADAGLPPAAIHEVSVNEVVIEVVQWHVAQAGEREVRLVPSLAMPVRDENEPVVAGDPELLRVMLANVLQNAVQHSPAGQTVEIAVRTIDDAQVQVTVTDHGPGIPSEHLEHMFERFFRLPGDNRTTGTGLGLSIAQGVARMHGGQITAANLPTGGCTFTMTLPLASG